MQDMEDTIYKFKRLQQSGASKSDAEDHLAQLPSKHRTRVGHPGDGALRAALLRCIDVSCCCWYKRTPGGICAPERLRRRPPSRAVLVGGDTPEWGTLGTSRRVRRAARRRCQLLL